MPKGYDRGCKEKEDLKSERSISMNNRMQLRWELSAPQHVWDPSAMVRLETARCRMQRGDDPRFSAYANNAGGFRPGAESHLSRVRYAKSLTYFCAVQRSEQDDRVINAIAYRETGCRVVGGFCTPVVVEYDEKRRDL